MKSFLLEQDEKEMIMAGFICFAVLIVCIIGRAIKTVIDFVKDSASRRTRRGNETRA